MSPNIIAALGVAGLLAAGGLYAEFAIIQGKNREIGELRGQITACQNATKALNATIADRDRRILNLATHEATAAPAVAAQCRDDASASFSRGVIFGKTLCSMDSHAKAAGGGQ